MSEWDAAYINDLKDSAFACVDAGGEKDEQGKTVPRSKRHYPHHKADGSIDLPHLRNALSRVAQEDTTTCGVAHLKAHAESEGVGGRSSKATPLEPDELEAWFAGKIPRRLLAIPFSGPIPGPAGKSRDLDMEYFDERTDIKPTWFDERPVDWHHSQDPSGKMNGILLGKAKNLTMEEDGWWVDLWLNAGERRLNLIRRLAEKGAELYGSSYAYPNLVKRGKDGHIQVWPYMMQTLSTSPQNTNSVHRPAKAVLDAFSQADIAVEPILRDVLAELDVLRDLPGTFPQGSDQAAKAGRELSRANLSEMDEWQDFLDELSKRIAAMRGRVRDKYDKKEDVSST